MELREKWVWELDSSSPSKWSRHLIVACPGHAFPNNLVMGDFIRSILSPAVVCFHHPTAKRDIFTLVMYCLGRHAAVALGINVFLAGLLTASGSPLVLHCSRYWPPASPLGCLPVHLTQGVLLHQSPVTI